MEIGTAGWMTSPGEQVYYDAKTGQYYTARTQNVMGRNLQVGARNIIGGTPFGASQSGLLPNQNQGASNYEIPNYMPAGLTAYGTEAVAPAVRPPRPTTPAPQFDMSAFQQALAQQGGQQGGPRPYNPTLTPGASVANAGPSVGGLAALRGIAAGTPTQG